VIRSRRTARVTVSAAVATALLLVTACATEADRSPLESSGAPEDATVTTGTGEPAEPAAGELSWESCGGGLECAELDVPVDYDDPEGETIPIGITRAPATGERIGALFVNPGGPGGTATDFAPQLAAVLPADITESFDIVGIDPRGLGASDISCGVDAASELYTLDYTIDSDEDEDVLLDVSQEYVDSCESNVGDLLPHLGTANVARDMDQVRAAMGDEQANLLMFSYGTAIAQVYADLFPDRVRAMVIDGVVELGPDGVESAAAQAVGFENALAAFIEDCDSDDTCPIGPDAEAAIDELIAQTEEEPIPASPRDLGPGDMQVGLAGALYAEFLWPDLANAVADGLDGNGTAMVQLADSYTQGGDFDIYFAVNCIDFAWPGSPEEMLADGVAANADAPHFGEAIVNDYVRCAMWPAPAEPLEAVTASGTPTILVVGTTNDPATPYAQAQRVAESLDDAVLLTYEGEGHGVVGNGVACIDDAVAAYLVDGETPDDGTSCSGAG
jgi:pimeloyl-ACP methyl ester carboxylesterase